tara:strand:+ start:555 stop:1445 length:891 start_codon:yes stop_codon:yes gene_type:complete
MMNKDESLIWEAYANLQEAPIKPGDSWDEPVEFDTSSKERLGKYSKDTLDDESLATIVTNIKDFIEAHENSTFPGDESDFQRKIIDLILDAVSESDTLKINSTNAKYVARVIKNELKNLGAIKVTDDEVDIKDAHPADIEASVEKGVDIGKAVAVGMKKSSATPGVESKSQIKYQARYHLNKEPSVEHHEQMQAGKNFLMQSDLGLSFTGKELLLALNKLTKHLNKSERLATRLLEAGVIEPMEEETEDDEERVVDVGDDDETGEQDYESSLRSAYADLKRDISSGASPTMRPSDW